MDVTLQKYKIFFIISILLITFAVKFKRLKQDGIKMWYCRTS